METGTRPTWVQNSHIFKACVWETEIWTLRRRDYPGLSKRGQFNHKGLHKKETGGSESSRQWDDGRKEKRWSNNRSRSERGGERFKDARLSALKMEGWGFPGGLQRRKLHTPSAGGTSSIPDQETKIPHVAKTSHAATKIQPSQNK